MKKIERKKNGKKCFFVKYHLFIIIFFIIVFFIIFIIIIFFVIFFIFILIITIIDNLDKLNALKAKNSNYVFGPSIHPSNRHLPLQSSDGAKNVGTLKVCQDGIGLNVVIQEQCEIKSCSLVDWTGIKYYIFKLIVCQKAARALGAGLNFVAADHLKARRGL